jgi:hypothetical protein
MCHAVAAANRGGDSVEGGRRSMGKEWPEAASNRARGRTGWKGNPWGCMLASRVGNHVVLPRRRAGEAAVIGGRGGLTRGPQGVEERRGPLTDGSNRQSG